MTRRFEVFSPAQPCGQTWRCAEGERPSAGGCSWQAARVKTINGSCLFDVHNFNETCAADARAPFPTASVAFRKAFASDDVAEGGCPPLRVA